MVSLRCLTLLSKVLKSVSRKKGDRKDWDTLVELCVRTFGSLDWLSYHVLVLDRWEGKGFRDLCCLCHLPSILVWLSPSVSGFWVDPLEDTTRKDLLRVTFVLSWRGSVGNLPNWLLIKGWNIKMWSGLVQVRLYTRSKRHLTEIVQLLQGEITPVILVSLSLPQVLHIIVGLFIILVYGPEGSIDILGRGEGIVISWVCGISVCSIDL